MNRAGGVLSFLCVKPPICFCTTLLMARADSSIVLTEPSGSEKTLFSKRLNQAKVVSSQHGFTKGKSYLANLIALHDGVTS